MARETLRKGIAVRALVRDPGSVAARALAAAGAELVRGDFGDPDSLRAAMRGVRAVFSMQQDGAPEAEFQSLVDAAVEADVEQFVHSSVSGVREQEAVLDGLEGDPKQAYWQAKVGQEQAVRAAPFGSRSYLRPALIVDNLALRAQFMYPRLASRGDLLVAMTADQRVAFISYDTIGRVAAAAFADPQRFADAEIELADAYASHADLAAALEDVTGRPVTVTVTELDEAEQLGLAPRVAHSHRWLTDVGYPARPEMLAPYGVEALPLREWVRRNADRIAVGGRPG